MFIYSLEFPALRTMFTHLSFQLDMMGGRLAGESSFMASRIQFRAHNCRNNESLKYSHNMYKHQLKILKCQVLEKAL